MRRLFTVLFGILLLSLLVSTVSAVIDSWPNWDEAAKYPDSTGDAIPVEDMTICYVTHDAQSLYFRIEIPGGKVGERAVLIYLDVDQNQATGDSGSDEDYGYDLHDLGAEWRLEYIIDFPPILKWNSVTNGWDRVASFNMAEQSDTYIMLQVRLSDLENPELPYVNILFISFATPGTDWNPDAGHITYGARPAVPVGGVFVPVNKFAILTPYLALIGLVGALTVAVAAKRRRKP